MVAAALTLIRYYLSSGVERPGAGRMASFEAWDDWVRQTVIYVNRDLAPGMFGDVMEQIQLNQASDPDQESLGVLLNALLLNFGDNSFCAADVCKSAQSVWPKDDSTNMAGQLADAIDDFNPRRIDLNAKSVGRILTFRKDRIVAGLSLEKLGELKGTAQWRVKRRDTDAAPIGGFGGFGGFDFPPMCGLAASQHLGQRTNPPNHPKPPWANN